MPEEKKEEKKAEDDKIILHVDIDCEGCKAKVRRALKEFKGVEGLAFSIPDQTVTIRGKLDAKAVYETVKKKSGKRTVLLYPDLKKVTEDADKAKAVEEPKKAEEPTPEPEVVVVLKVNMHCGACAKQIRRSLLKMDGVTDVKEDFAKSIVTVKGKGIDPGKLCARVKKRSGKHCEVVPPPPPPPAPKEEEKKEEAKPAEEKKEEEKKEEAKPAAEEPKPEEKPAEAAGGGSAPPADGEKKEEEKKEEEKKEEAAAPEEKKEEKAEEKKEEGKDEKKEEKKKEEGKEEKKEEKKEEGESTVEVKKYEYTCYRSVPEYYVYPPQIFSDENPNACSIM